jgi:hypothetical protein
MPGPEEKWRLVLGVRGLQKWKLWFLEELQINGGVAYVKTVEHPDCSRCYGENMAQAAIAISLWLFPLC